MPRWIIQHEASVTATPKELIKELLLLRNFKDEEQSYFLEPKLAHLQDPRRIPDMLKFIDRIKQSLLRQEKVLIYGDYDVDGITSSSLMYKFLKYLGFENLNVFIPDRVKHGYGLSMKAIDDLLPKAKPDLWICLDCGTTSVNEVKFLKEQGIEVMIVDHHEVDSNHDLPDALALVNPQRNHDQKDDFIFASVGLVFKFCHAFIKEMKEEGKDITEASEFLQNHLDIVALGTVADIVPLEKDNRILVKFGLDKMKRTKHIGLQELIDVGAVKASQITTYDLGFKLGPRLNACGRMDDALDGFRLLTSTDRTVAKKIAQQLNRQNMDRQSTEKNVLDEAVKLSEELVKPDEDRCVVVSSRQWHEGVIGIVASRILRKYYLPTFIIAVNEEGLGKGSGRSIEGCPLGEAIRASSQFLIKGGGHEMAGGVSIEESQIDNFRNSLNQWMKDNVAPDAFEEKVKIDLVVHPHHLNLDLYNQMKQLEPFGQKNRPPVIAVTRVRVKSKRTFKEEHAEFQLENEKGKSFLAFGFGFAKKEVPGQWIDVAGEFQWDDYKNKPSLRLVDWRASS
jgi:single-stranded-DNA-specific exonuclease